MAAHRSTDGLQMREHRARATDAVEADDVGAGVLELLARLGRGQAVTRRRLLVQCERYDRGKARLLDDVECDQRLLGEGERLRDDEVGSGVDRPGCLLLEHPAHGPARLVVRREEVRVRQVACKKRTALVYRYCFSLDLTIGCCNRDISSNS